MHYNYTMYFENKVFSWRLKQLKLKNIRFSYREIERIGPVMSSSCHLAIYFSVLLFLSIILLNCCIWLQPVLPDDRPRSGPWRRSRQPLLPPCLLARNWWKRFTTSFWSARSATTPTVDRRHCPVFTRSARRASRSSTTPSDSELTGARHICLSHLIILISVTIVFIVVYIYKDNSSSVSPASRLRHTWKSSYASKDPERIVGVPRRQPHRRSVLATLPSVGAIP